MLLAQSSLAALILSLFLSAWQVALVDAGKARILIYSATQRFRHDSIPVAVNALQTKGQLAIEADFEHTEDEGRFTDENLSKYDVIIFLSTTGEVLRSDTPFKNYIDSGGNFVGIHSASDTLRKSTAYVNQLGSKFDYHADLQPFTVNVADQSHPSVSMLPTSWTIRDEAYNFEFDPRSLGAKVVLTADESSYTDNGPRRFNQGSPHPIAWYQEKGAGVNPGRTAGRSFYTSLGHLLCSFQDELFISHVLGGISWVLQGNTTRAYASNATVGNPQVTSVPNASLSAKTPSASGSTPSAGLPTGGDSRRKTCSPAMFGLLAVMSICFILSQ